MQNGQPPDSLNSYLLGSQNPSSSSAIFQKLNALLQQQQAAQSRTELTGQSSSSVPFRQYQTQNSPAGSISTSQSIHQKLLSQGSASRPQTANYLSIPSSSQGNWRSNQASSTPGPSASTSSLRFSNLNSGTSPAPANPEAPQKPSTPLVAHHSAASQGLPSTVLDQGSTTGTPQPKRPISPSKLSKIGELLKKTDDDLYDLLKGATVNEILASFGDLETIEDDPELVDLLPDEMAIRTQHKQEFREHSTEYDKVSLEVEDLKKQLQELTAKQEVQKRNKILLNREEHEVPQTSQMPADILIEQIAHENRLNLKFFDLKRLEFKIDFAEDDDPDFVDIDIPNDAVTVDENDLLSISQRPTCYEPSEVVNFEEERARYWPLIKSLAYVLEDFYREQCDSLENLHEKFCSHAKPWKMKQDKAERNTKKIHRDNKNREIYEKTFQDIKKAREEKERSARCEKRPNAKQEAALAKARYEEKKKVFGSAIIPPVMQVSLMMDQPRGKIIENPMFESLQSLNRFLKSWTDYEKSMYQKKFSQYGKNFAAISSCLGTKSTNECIRYYYLTKQHVKYKQLHKMKKKKAGKQYKPTMVPTDGERMAERIRQFPFMRSNKYVECLICEKQMPVYLVPKLIKGMHVTGEFEETIKDELPICDACNTHIRKAKAANFSKCPLLGCSLGRRRTKPNRTIPETANTLDLEKRRFIIHRRKLHPEAVKCCGSCIRKIQNDFADLAAGKLDSEIKQFTKAREERKMRKENENIPSWKNWELDKLVEAVKIHGISNWYEIASTMGISSKTPFWCYEKYKELQLNGQWDKMVKFESSMNFLEQSNPKIGESVKYVCDLMDNIVLKEMENEIFKIKKEITTPVDSPISSNLDESEYSSEFYSNLDKFNQREMDILRFEYLTMIKNFQDENPESPVEVKFENEIVQESGSRENFPEPMEDDDEIQVIEVKPPQKHGNSGSLTQGTPRSGGDSFNFSNNITSNAPSPFEINPTVMSNPITLTDIFDIQQKSQNIQNFLGRLQSGELPIQNLQSTTSNAHIGFTNTNSLSSGNILPTALPLFNNIFTNSVITTQQPLGLKQIFKDGQQNQSLDTPLGHATPSPGGRKSGELDRPPTADVVKRKSGVANTMLPHTHMGMKSMHIKRSFSPAISQHDQFHDVDQVNLDINESRVKESEMNVSELQESKLLLLSPKATSMVKTMENVSSIQEQGNKIVKQEVQDENDVIQSSKQIAFSHLRFPWESPRPPPDSSRIPLSPPLKGARRGSPISDVFIHRHLREDIERPQSHGAVPNLTSDIEQPEIDSHASQKMNDPLGLGESALSPAEDVYEFVDKINEEKRKFDAEEAKKRLEDAMLKQDDDDVIIEGTISSDILSLDDESTKKGKLDNQEKTLDDIVSETLAKINQAVMEKTKIGGKSDSTLLTPKAMKIENSENNVQMRQLSPKMIETELYDSKYPKFVKNSYNPLNVTTDDPTVTLGAPITSVEQDNLLAAFEGWESRTIGNIPSRLDDIACTICVDAANYIRSNPSASVDEVYAAMIITCKHYAQYFLTCQSTLDIYLQDIYLQAHNPLMTSRSICYKLELCHDKNPTSG